MAADAGGLVTTTLLSLLLLKDNHLVATATDWYMWLIFSPFALIAYVLTNMSLSRYEGKQA